MKTLFLGTPAFAVPSLRAIVAAGHEVLAVLCRPDKPKGRGMKFEAPPVKLAAQELGLAVHQPAKLRDPVLRDQLRALAPDIVVVVAYGLLVPKWTLELAPAGCINVHGSILPRLRGAAPIQHAILEGFETTGISLMRLDEGMDTGPVFMTRELSVGTEETAGELSDRMAKLGAEVLPEALEAIVSGRMAAVPQENSGATMAPKIPADREALRFDEAAERIDRLARALAPRPGAYTLFRGRRLKILGCRVGTGESARPGSLRPDGRDGALRVACGEGWLEVTRLQPEGKRVMAAKEFLAGQRLTGDECFETPPTPEAGETPC